MWISLLLALLTYLASPKGSDSERRKALLTAAAVGGASYVATEYTDWGRDVSDQFDDLIGVGGDTGTADEIVSRPTIKDSSGKPSGGTGSFGKWLPGIVGAGVGAAVASGGVPSWLVWAGLFAAAYLVLK